MKGKSKKSIVILIVLLAIGFAAVTTTLTINGIIRIGANEDNFKKNVIFSEAKLVYSDASKSADEGEVEIVNDGKGITFTTKRLTAIGETVTLEYKIRNNSQYTAKLQGINCTVKNADEHDVTNEVIEAQTGDYIKLEKEAVADTLKKGEETEEKDITITMIKSYIGTATKNETTYSVECTIEAQGSTEED